MGWYFRPILNSEVTWKNSLILYSVSKPKTVNCCWLSSGCYIHVYKMYKTKWKKPDPLRMCLVLGLLGVRGGNAHQSLSYWWSFSICGAPQRLSSCISIGFSVSKLRSLFLWNSYFSMQYFRLLPLCQALLKWLVQSIMSLIVFCMLQLRELEDKYAECMEMLHEAQEELKNLRNKTMPNAISRRYHSLGLFPMVRR